VLLIGNETSKTILEYFVSSLLDIYILFLAIYSFYPVLKRGKLPVLNFFDWIVIIFAISNIVLGIILAHNIKLSIYAIRMSYVPLIFYFLIKFHKNNLIEVKVLVDKIFKIFFFVALAGFILYFGFYETMINMINRAGGVVNEYFVIRMTSFFWSPVIFGTFMAISFLYFFYKETQKHSFYNYIFISAIWICLLLSVSRGPLVISVIGILFLTFLLKKWKNLFITICLTILCFFIISYYINSPSEFIRWTMHSSVGTVSLEKNNTRADLWKKSFEDFRYNPFGHGLGKAGHVAARFSNKNYKEFSASSTDGWFLKLANETGVWGLISYLFLALTFSIQSVKYIYQKNNKLFIFIFVIFIIINIQNIVSNVLDFYLLAHLFWLLIGISQIIKTESSINEKS
jgi:hypothetical protein